MSGRFVESSSGIITDTKTGKQWICGPLYDVTSEELAGLLPLLPKGWGLPTLDDVLGLEGEGFSRLKITSAYWIKDGERVVLHGCSKGKALAVKGETCNHLILSR